MEILTRLQNWYKINCNGDWEHSYGISITTIDNPGWSIKINLQETCLDNIKFEANYQNQTNEHDWYFIRVEDNNLNISCGPNNLTIALAIFFDEIIPHHSNLDFLYEVYIPLVGYKHQLWTPALGKLISENSLEIIQIHPINLKELKTKSLEQFNFKEIEIGNFQSQYKVGDKVQTGLEETFDGIKLIAI